MNKLIYSGSGINAPDEFLYEVENGKEKAFPHNIKNKLSFLTIGRDKKNICGVSIDGRKSHIIKFNLSDKTSEKIITVNDNAVYYPIASPSGKKIAFLETPNKSYPPMRDDEALIKVLEKTENSWELTKYQGETLLDPFDWGENDEFLLFPDNNGNLIKENILTSKKNIIAENIFYPRLSHSGNILAYYNGEAIVIEKDSKKEICKIVEDAQYVFFDSNDEAVFYIAPSAFWKMAVFKIALNNTKKEPEKVFETSEITFAALI